MKTCDNCGKKISSLESYKEDGKTLCMACALGTEYKKEKLNNPTPNKNYDNDKSTNIIYHAEKFKLKSTNGWALGMKILLLALLVVLIFASLAIAIIVSLEEDNFFLGAGIFVGSFVLSFSIVGFAMTFLQLAEDISYIKNYLSNECKKDKDI